MTPKQKVLKEWPDAYAAQDVNGYWWIWTPKLREALNGSRAETRSAANAWMYALEMMPPNKSSAPK